MIVKCETNLRCVWLVQLEQQEYSVGKIEAKVSQNRNRKLD